MTSPTNFPVAIYSSSGELLDSVQFDSGQFEANHLDYFRKKLGHLSGDLELPLEDKLPGDVEFTDYRVGSDLNGAYVLYYFHDEVVFASLILSGTDEVAETELMQVFKFLLLDTEDADEPTEEEIEEILESSAFDFPEFESRPIVFEVRLSDRAEDSDTIKHVAEMNRQLANAFFAIDRSAMN